MKTPKRAILYHYFEASKTYRDNLLYFLAKTISENADIFLILSSDCSVSLPKRRNLIIVRAPNINLDYGGYCHAISQYSVRLSKYEQLIFVNSSVRGPFLPSYISNSWIDVFTESLDCDADLVGATHCELSESSSLSRKYAERTNEVGPFFHIQSTAYAMSNKVFVELLKSGFYDQSEQLTKFEVILRYEIGMSNFVMSKGWKVRSILAGDNLDNLKMSPDFGNFSALQGDPQFPNSYFGRTICAEESIFVKTNRNILSDRNLASLTFSHLSCLDECLPDEWDQMADLKLRSYRIARTEYDTMIKTYRSFRAKLVRRISRLLLGKTKTPKFD